MPVRIISGVTFSSFTLNFVETPQLEIFFISRAQICDNLKTLMEASHNISIFLLLWCCHIFFSCFSFVSLICVIICTLYWGKRKSYDIHSPQIFNIILRQCLLCNYTNLGKSCPKNRKRTAIFAVTIMFTCDAWYISVACFCCVPMLQAPLFMLFL